MNTTSHPFHRNLIGGEWKPASDVQENRSPSNVNDVVGLYAQGDATDVAQAVAAARAALDNWWSRGPQARSDVLDAAATELQNHRSEIGRLLAREQGKTLAEATAEVMRASQIFRFFAGEALRMTGERIDSVRPNVDIEVTREPAGVVGLITPWNFPIAIPAWKVAPALAYGNTVIIKPADLTPGSVHALAEILMRCGCPPGAFNLVMGRGRVVGNALVEHPGVDAISFTGSEGVGRDVIARCAASHKRVQAEMGGKNPTVILDDADLQHAVAAGISSAYGSTGQRCTATSRFIVEQGIRQDFETAFVEAATRIVVGDSLNPCTTMGPVVSSSQLAANLGYVELARREGARVVGGERVDTGVPGHYQRPAVFLDATNDMRVSREEIFGPCASIIEARDFEHALALANDTLYGLSSAICTRNLKFAREFKRRSQAGLVMVNLPSAGVDFHVPFGGRKGSSFGPREQGTYARDFYTTVKTAYTLAV